MNAYDFQVILHPTRRDGEDGYTVSMRHVNGARGLELRKHVVLETYPFTDAGYNAANRLAQRLISAVEEQTMPFYTGLPMAGLRIDYIRSDRVHEEAVE